MRFIRYLKPYWIIALCSPLLMIGEVVAELTLPKMMATIINDGLGNNQPDLIFELGIKMLIITFLGGLAGFLAIVCSTRAGHHFADDLRKDAFSKVVHLSFEQTDAFTTGSLITRITNDIENMRIIVAQSLRMFVRAGLLFIGGIILMLSIHIRFGIILLIILPIEVFVIIFFLRRAFPLFEKVQTSIDQVNVVMQENVTGSRVVKAYVREAYESERFEQANYNLATTNLRVQKNLAFIGPALMFFMDLTVIIIIYFGGLEVRNASATLEIGDIMAGINYIGQILMAVQMAGMMFQSITRSKASGRRLREVLESHPVVQSGDYQVKRVKGEIRYENVMFRYPATIGSPVLTDLNLDIKSGETLAILGATGSGKTSLVNLLPRFYDCTSGNIYLDGVNVNEYDLTSLRDQMGIVPQKTELFSGTIEDNLRWGKSDATIEEIKEACRIAQADDFIESFKDGYQTIIGEKGSSLSGGQKQRLAIARAILKKPPILIFDDSTSALDLTTEANLYRALRENFHDVTIILIAQRVASVKGANRIAIIEQGKLIACDNHDNLLKTCQVYQDIYYSQLKNGGGLQ